MNKRKRTATIEEAAKLLGVGRTTAYEEAKRGSLAGVPVIRVGRRLLLPMEPLERILSGEQRAETNA